jgi:uncharacterized protein (DUF779 family)
MTPPEEPLAATEAALALIERLRAEHGPLVFFQSGGCCEGSSPMCLHEGELLVAPSDLLLGEVGGTPFYIDAEQYERWNRPVLLVDVAPGPADSLSLEGSAGVHFVVRSDSCPVPASAGSVATPGSERRTG